MKLAIHSRNITLISAIWSRFHWKLRPWLRYGVAIPDDIQ